MGLYTEKTEISYDDYLKLEGLLVLAKDVEKQSKALMRAVAALIGEKDPEGDGGHAADACYCGYDARTLLTKSDIPVPLPPEPAARA